MPRDRTKPWIDVLIYGDKAIVKKMTFQDDERVAAKYGLTVDGEWILVSEGKPYPDECVLPYHDLSGDLTFYLGAGGENA